MHTSKVLGAYPTCQGSNGPYLQLGMCIWTGPSIRALSLDWDMNVIGAVVSTLAFVYISVTIEIPDVTSQEGEKCICHLFGKRSPTE